MKLQNEVSQCKRSESIQYLDHILINNDHVFQITALAFAVCKPRSKGFVFDFPKLPLSLTEFLQVVAKKRAGMGGTYMKRLKLASDSLKNTDPEANLGTVLNMESYLAFKGETKK